MEPPKNSDRTKKKKKTSVQYSEETLKKALNEIRNEKKGIRATCRRYNIPRTTIQDRLSGKRSDAIETRGPDPILGIEGEKKVKEWLLTIAKCGFPVKKQELLDTVQKIVKDHGTKNPFKDDRPGQTWYLNFLKRHPDISCRTAEGINKARAKVTEESIRTWFKDLFEFLKESHNESILECPERIFNGDESGFSMCPKTGKVLAPKGYRNLYQIKAGNEKDNLTVLVTFNASGQVSPPLVVFPYVRPARAVIDSMPEEWCLGRSESGWMRSDVFFEYITNDFNNWVNRNSIKKPILLLVDGHKSHMSLVLSAMCEKIGIILYALPPNTTHMLQPADVSVFGPLKSSWKVVVRKFLSKPENVNSCVNKTNFCQLFRDTLEDTNMATNIKNGFKKCGLYPFNPDAVDYSKCVQNTIENVHKVATHSLKDITNSDLASTRKVLKHLRPVLKQKKINITTIFKELRKLKTKTDCHETDSEDITDCSIDQSTSLQMEYSADGVSLTDPSLPVLTNINDVLSLTDGENRVENASTSMKNNEGEVHKITVTAEVHSASPSTLDMDRSLPAVANATHDQAYVSNNDILHPISHDTFDEILPFPNDDILNIRKNQPNDILLTFNITEKEPTGDRTIETFDTFSLPDNIIANVTAEDNLSTLHLTGTDVNSYLEVGSLVSLDDVVFMPSPKNVTLAKPEAFKKHLFIPDPPQRAKAKQVKTPAAISSEAWRKYYEEKENVKAEKQEATLKRKQERVEAAKQKKNKKDVKKQTRIRSSRNIKTNKDVVLKEMCTECEDILISDAEEDKDKNVGCDFCQRWYHLKCTTFVGSSYIDVIDQLFKCKVCIADQE